MIHIQMLQKLNIKRGGFTLVEIMIVVTIIALLAMISVPNFLRSRRRSQATQVLQDLRMIDSAISMYAVENNKSASSGVSWTDVRIYLKPGTRLEASGAKDVIGSTFTIPAVDTTPKVPLATFNALSNEAPTSFWSPYHQ